MAEVIRMLFLPRERFPSFRGRISVLFGRELLSRGHQIDLAMQAADDNVPFGVREWCGRTVYVGRTDNGTNFVSRLNRHFLALRHDVLCLLRASPTQYDAILVSDKFLVAAVASFVCRVRHMKFLFWLTFPEHESQLLRARTRSARYPLLAWARGRLSSFLLYRVIVPRCDHLFVQSPKMALNLEVCGADPRRMTPILTGVDLADFPATVAIRSSNELRPFTIAYLGTLDRERRLEVLVEMVDLLVRQKVDVELLLIGDGDKPGDRELIENKARELRVSGNIRITGFMARAEALRLLATADAGISPFYPNKILEVASPTKLVEYMALGLPVIANDQMEQRMVLQASRSGLCVPWGARYFSRAVRWLSVRTPVERAAMGLRGRKWIEANRTYASIADEFERVCIAAINANAGLGAAPVKK